MGEVQSHGKQVKTCWNKELRELVGNLIAIVEERNYKSYMFNQLKQSSIFRKLLRYCSLFFEYEEVKFGAFVVECSEGIHKLLNQLLLSE